MQAELDQRKTDNPGKGWETVSASNGFSVCLALIDFTFKDEQAKGRDRVKRNTLVDEIAKLKMKAGDFILQLTLTVHIVYPDRRT